MLAFQFAVGEDAHDLARCHPRNSHVFAVRFNVVRQNHKCGKLVGIDKQRDALDVFFFGIDQTERL